MKMLLPFIILSLFLFGCNNQEESVSQDLTHLPIPPTSGPTSEEILRLQREQMLREQEEADSIKRAYIAALPVSYTYVQGEDSDFNKFISVTIKNNTKEVIKSILLYIIYNPYQGGLGAKKKRLEKRSVNIYPGRTTKVRLNEELFVDNIMVLKYYGNQSGMNVNGYEAAGVIIEIEAEKINPNYKNGF